MADIALTLIQHGASSGLAGLDQLGKELSLFLRLIYDAPGTNALDNDCPLVEVEWQAMDPQRSFVRISPIPPQLRRERHPKTSHPSPLCSGVTR
jgi:hypothetical protein